MNGINQASPKIIGVEFDKSVVGVKNEHSDGGLPEICFIGRSNVGKSSAINLLTGRKIARTSSTPGATRAVNLFNVVYDRNGVKNKVIFSDFPGFGYAKVPRTESRKWQQMIENYIVRNKRIRRIVWLFDIRREMDELDRMLVEWLTANRLDYCFVLTKADKENQSIQVRRRQYFEQLLKGIPVLLLSAKTGKGKPRLISFLLDSL